MTDISVAEAMKDLSAAERAVEVERIMKCFKLNPFEYLGVDLETTPEELNKIYRKRSLLIHPDKCKHPDARTAFSALAAAKKDCSDENKRNIMKATLDDAKAKLIHQKKLKPDDPQIKSKEFKEELRKEVNTILADIEWRKRQLQRRMTEEEGRAKIEEEERREERKRKAEAEKKWEDGRDVRMADWQSFLKKGKKKRSKRVKKEGDFSNDVSIKLAKVNASKSKS